MKPMVALLAVFALFAASTTCADYGVVNEGLWPADWPKELESLRKQARTLDGPLIESRHFAIPFNQREEFESAWSHILSVKTKGAPLVLRRGPNFFLGDGRVAGVCIHTPPEGQAPAADIKLVHGNWERTIYVELIVDGTIIDLNRIELPADTPIIDERFPKPSSPDSKP